MENEGRTCYSVTEAFAREAGRVQIGEVIGVLEEERRGGERKTRENVNKRKDIQREGCTVKRRDAEGRKVEK